MGAEIVIVDDDPMVGEVTRDFLASAGYTTHLVRDTRAALSILLEERPRLVLLDILMPGRDGLSVLREIKNTPELASVKVAVLSGKNFPVEIERARSLGADLFIQKPYNTHTFTERIVEIIGPPSKEKPPEGEIAAVKTSVSVRFWGSSKPTSTPCVSLETQERLFILDAGDGIAALGDSVLREGKHKEAWLLLSHFHPDHVSGLGVAPLLRAEGFSLHILGPSEPDKSLAVFLRETIEKSFSVLPKPIAAKLTLHQLQEETYEVAPGIRIAAFYANHPSTTLGLRLDMGGRRIVYCPDSELYGEGATALQDYDEKLGWLCRSADLLIHDARYSEADYAQHAKEGHSSAIITAAFAAENKAARLVLFHTDPSYSPQDLQALEAAAKAVFDARGVRIPCWAAKDGLTVDL